jgi:uncharacterized protein
MILFIAALAAVLALAGASLLTFDPDILNLIPQQNKEVNDFRKVLTSMGTIDYHIIVLDLPSGHDITEYESLIEDIGQSFEKSPLIENVAYKVPNPVDLIDKVLPRALLFLTPAEIDRVGENLTDAQIRESVARNRALLETPQAIALKDVVRYDPFNLLPIYLDHFRTSGSGFRLDVSNGYYQSLDHHMVLILTKPRRPAQDLPFSRKIIAATDQIERNAMKRFRERTAGQVPLPAFEHTGGYAIAFDDSELIKKDIAANVFFSFFGVLALFLYAFRRSASLAYAGVPLSLGLALTFGLAGVTYGMLSSASAGFAALLAGLGIDFITVLYGRYVDERNRGVEMAEALRTTLRTTLPGVFVAAITTAGTFYAFLATDFRGMTQLGFLTGTGILLFLLCVMFLLPALIVVTEGKKKGKAPKLYLHSFGSERLIDYSVAHPRRVVVAWCIFVAVSALLATRIRFSDNIQDLRAKGNRGMVTQQKVTKNFGQSFDFMMAVVEGKTLDETLARTEAAAEDLNGLVQQHKVASYQSISTYLPTVSQQQLVIQKLRAGAAGEFSFDRINSTFHKALVDTGFRAESYDGYMQLFRQALAPAEPVTLENLGPEELRKLTERYLKKTPAGYMSVIYVYPVSGVWSRELSPDLLAFRARHPNSIFTGVNLVSETLRKIIRADAIRATIIGFIAVLVLMYISFRSVRFAILSFVPFLAGSIGMLGMMAVMGLDFNFMNVFVGLMIIGCGTDYAVYMLQRFREDHEAFTAGAAETGKAVVMAAITSIVGYGSFALSHYPGLRSIGYASTFGLGFSGLAAISLLPAILTMKRSPKSEV